MAAPANFVFIYVTCPTLTIAKKIANQLVEDRRVACANILPEMQSIYRWEGRLHLDREVVLILKTRKSLFGAVERAIKKMHPYKVPCIVALPLVRGERGYLKWLKAETT